VLHGATGSQQELDFEAEEAAILEEDRCIPLLRQNSARIARAQRSSLASDRRHAQS